MTTRQHDEELAKTLADVEALTAEWAGPGPAAPLAVAHQDPVSGLVTFHIRGLPAHLEYILAALRAAPPVRPIVLVASPVAGMPAQRAEVWEDVPGARNVRVVYCDSRTSARVARHRIIGTDAVSS